MAGEWHFTFLGDKSTFQLKEYQNLLLEIRENYAELIPDPDMKGSNQVKEFWLPKENEFDEQGPPDNIFAKFSYECKLHNWHNANPSWILYWNPTIVGNPMSDVHALCASDEFTIFSMHIQKRLANAFPNHFQLFYELGTSGPGGKCQYFGVPPEGFGAVEESDSDSDCSIDGSKLEYFPLLRKMQLEKYTNRQFVLEHQRQQINKQMQFKDQKYVFSTMFTANDQKPPHAAVPSFSVKSIIPPNRVCIQDLKMHVGKTLTGKYFLCRNITPPFIMTSMMTIVEDPEGIHAIRLALYNFTTATFTDDLTKVLPIGAILVIMNPWFKPTADGGYTLRCDNPTEVLRMTEKVFNAMFPRLSWKGSIPNEYLPLQKKSIKSTSESSDPKRMGNEYFVKQQYLEALKEYNTAIDLLSKYTDNLDLLSNRAAVFLKLTWFSLALKDTETVLKHDPSHTKAIYRKSKALCGLGKPVEAVDFLKAQLFRFHKDSDTYKIIANEIGKISIMKKQLTGEYDILDLMEQSKKRQPLEDTLEYTGPIEVVPIEGKGRGVIASRDINAGELLMASRAFAVIFLKDDATTNHQTLIIEVNENNRTGIAKSENQRKLFSLITQRVTHDANSMKQLYGLYAGPEKGFLEIGVEKDCELDLERIQQIIEHNAFKVVTEVQKSFSEGDIFSNSEGGLFLLPSLINHSCFDCNATGLFYGDFMFIRTVKNVDKGEEILISYVPPDQNLEKRTAALKKFGFTCNCSLCAYNRAETLESTLAVDKIMIDIQKKKTKPFFDAWLQKSIVTLKSIRQIDNLNVDLVNLYEHLAFLHFKNGNLKESIEILKKAYTIVDGSIFIHHACTIAYNIVTTYLLQGGKQNIRHARLWTPKLKNNSLIAFGTLDVLRNKKGWDPQQNFETLLKVNGIHLD